jgi:hypothetical protein
VFGRLSAKKRPQAVAILVEVIQSTSKFFIHFSVNHEKTEPYLDEVYLLAFVFSGNTYLNWRRKRLEAFEDMEKVFHIVFTDVYQSKYKDLPLKSGAQNETEFLEQMLDLRDTRTEEYLEALRIEHESFQKAKRELLRTDGDQGITTELLASANSVSPFKDLVTERVFDVKPKQENSDRYIGLS